MTKEEKMIMAENMIKFCVAAKVKLALPKRNKIQNRHADES